MAATTGLVLVLLLQCRPRRSSPSWYLKVPNNFEAGEGKTVLDTHFARVSHKIVRWVRVGNNLDSGEQLANLLEVWIIKTKIEVHCSKYLHGFSVRHTIFTLA